MVLNQQESLIRDTFEFLVKKVLEKFDLIDTACCQCGGLKCNCCVSILPNIIRAQLLEIPITYEYSDDIPLNDDDALGYPSRPLYCILSDKIYKWSVMQQFPVLPLFTMVGVEEELFRPKEISNAADSCDNMNVPGRNMLVENDETVAGVAPLVAKLYAQLFEVFYHGPSLPDPTLEYTVSTYLTVSIKVGLFSLFPLIRHRSQYVFEI